MLRRLAVLEEVVPEVARVFGLTAETALLVAAVFLRRTGRADDLAEDVGRGYADVLASAQSLAAHGLLERRAEGPSWRLPRPTYALSSTVEDEIRQCLAPPCRAGITPVAAAPGVIPARSATLS